MAAARFATGARHSWFGNWHRATADETLVIHRRHVSHYLGYVGAGQITTRWVTRSVERHYHASAGTLRFYPADQERHTFIKQANPVNYFYILVIPTAVEEDIFASERMDPHAELRHLHVRNDAELCWCMKHLAAHASRDGYGMECEDEAARRLMLRLAQLSGIALPEWCADSGAFDNRALAHLVEYVDAHLKNAPRLSDMSMLVGLSPSHFAKKFRQSTGLSLHRFVNRRRIRASFELLKRDSQPLAHVALELGFSSQSHFTRLFSDLTGMTPAKYRKQFKRTVV